MGLFDRIIDFFDGDDGPELTKYRYNYCYFPPIPMIDDVPGSGLAYGWAVEVAILQSRIMVNLLALVLDESQEDLVQELDDVNQGVQAGNLLKTLWELVDFSAKLAARRPDLLDDFAAGFRRLIGQLAQRDNNLTLDFWILFVEAQNSLLADLNETHLSSIEEYELLFEHLKLPRIAPLWNDDDTFAEMRVSGPNPEALERLTAIPDKFPITEEKYSRVMAGDSLAEALADGRLFWVDYHIFEGMLLGSYPGPQKYMGAPMALFAVPKEGDRRLKVVAIQCGQDPARFPIFSPPREDDDASAPWRWSMAKTWFSVSDGNFQEAVAHLGRTHLLMSPFSIATPNQLGPKHPVGKLLLPHFEGTFSINNSAQAALIAPNGVIDQIMGGTIDMSRVFGGLGAQSFSHHFDRCYFPERLAQRGVDDPQKLPYYPFRDGGMLLWNAIHTWVSEYLAAVYPTEDRPESDEALQAWYRELTSHEGGRLKAFGEDGALRTRSYLARALTMVIFTASAAHAAQNFPQLDIMSYPPAMPLAAYSPPPEADLPYTKTDLLNMLPPKRQAVIQMNTGTLLGGIYYTRLGDYGEDYFKDPGILEALGRFQARLREIEEEIKTRFPDYPYLLPSRIPRSINI